MTVSAAVAARTATGRTAASNDTGANVANRRARVTTGL